MNDFELDKLEFIDTFQKFLSIKFVDSDTVSKS